MAKVPHRLRELRQLRGWTAQELAERVGAFQSTVTRIESGQQKLTLEWLLRFATALGVRACDLIVDDQAVQFAPVIADLGQKDRSNPLFDPEERTLVPIPAPWPIGSGDVVAFRTLEDGLLFAEQRFPMAQQVGKTFVVRRRSLDKPRTELGIYVFEQLDGASGFFATEGHPDDRWLRVGYGRIIESWLALAEFRKL